MISSIGNSIISNVYNKPQVKLDFKEIPSDDFSTLTAEQNKEYLAENKLFNPALSFATMQEVLNFDGVLDSDISEEYTKITEAYEKINQQMAEIDNLLAQLEA